MPSKNQKSTIVFYLSAIFVIGIILAVYFFSQPSEPENRFLFGMSLARFMVGVVFVVLLAGNLLAVVSSITHIWPWQENFSKRLTSVFSTKTGLYAVVTGLYVAVLFSGASLALTLMPVAEGFASYIGILVRLSSLLLWVFLAGILLIALTATLYKNVLKDLFSPLKTVVWVLLFLSAYILVVMYYREAAYVLSLRHFEPSLLGLGVFLFVWALVSEYAPDGWYKAALDRSFLLIGIFLIAFVLYGHVATWVDWVHKGRYEYWNVLAEQFVNGKLYIPDPSKPGLAHDLTLYQGKWYVPNPPIPAVILMPLMLFVKAQDIHMGDVSMFFSALNVFFVFLILEQFIKRQWIKISQGTALWLVVLFGFGTNHLWVGINGGMWFVSQILTVTFLVFSILASLKSWSPLFVGLGLGLAIGARPNSLMTWPFVFAIAMQIMKEKGIRVDFKQMLAWSIKSAIPVGLAVVGLLLYNYARFDDFMDFGYTTINGDPTIVKNAQVYGLFSPRYILYNLEVMFLYLPKIQWGSVWLFSPAKAGMSVFLSTPPLIYLLRRYEIKWWILGAWAAIFFNFALLMLYHNTGADQFGYRYILDSIIPIIALMALSFEKKIPWHFIVLLILSIVINIYGAAWFVNA